MRARQLTLPLFLLIAVLLVGAGASGRFANAALQDATPAAADATPAAAEASPVAEPADVPDDAVTLAFSYTPDETGEFLVLVPIEADGLLLTAGEPRGDDEPGTVDFASPRNDDLPWIRYENNVFEAYEVLDDPGLVQRWVYFNEDSEARPSTLVLQIVCVRGEYDGFEGTATFVSRGAELGGTLILALDPPEDGEPADAEDAPEE